MELFEFLMVLVSIIIGLGVAEVLTGVARVLRHPDSVQRYWVHTVTAVTIFLALLQTWWESWSLREATEWSFPGLLMMLAGPVCLFLMAHLLYPEEMPGSDLREYYYRIARPFWTLAALAVTGSVTFRPLIFGQALFRVDNATSFIMFLGFVALVISKNRLLHSVLVPAFLILLLLDTLLINYLIGAN